MSAIDKLLRTTLEGLWTPVQGQSFRGLTVFPIFPALKWNPATRKNLGYVTLQEAIEHKLAVVSEMPSAHVPELLFTNQGGRPVLAIDGDELVGGKQNRAVNSTLLMGSGDTRVPVTCVEQGRWRVSKSNNFSGGERLPHGMRASSHGHVGANLRSHGGHASDQRAVWRDIEHGHSSHHTRSDTGALNDWYKAQGEVFQAYQTALPYTPHAVGLAIAIGGRMAGCDIFDQAKTAEFYWPRIVKASASEASRADHTPPSGPADLLERAKSCTLEVFPSPGLGRDVRLRGNGLTGSALIHEDVLVHLSLFNQPGEA